MWEGSLHSLTKVALPSILISISKLGGLNFAEDPEQEGPDGYEDN